MKILLIYQKFLTIQSNVFNMVCNKQIVIDPEQKIVYILEIIKAKRNINPSAKRKADELIVVGMNFENFKKRYPELADQIKEIKEP